MSEKKSSLALVTYVLPLLGAACLLAGVGWAVWLATFTKPIVALIGVGVLLFFSLFVRAEKANLQYYLHVIVYSLMVGGICVVVYLFAGQYTIQKDLTKGRLHSLSDESVNFLKTLDKKVKITIFAPASEPFENVERLYNASTNKLEWAFVDPVKDPLLARKMGDRVNVGDMFFECGTNKKKVNAAELDPSFVQMPVLAENTFTNSIVEVTRKSRPKLYFLTGHGEIPIKAEDDAKDSEAAMTNQGQRRRSSKPSVGKLCDALNGRGIDTAPLDLVGAGKVPDDATIVVLAGPTRDLFDSEYAALDDFLKGDLTGKKAAGKLLVLLDPLTADMQPITTPNIDKLLAEYGIVVENGLIFDSMSSLLGVNPPVYPLLGAMDPRHPITAKVVELSGKARSFVPGVARSLTKGKVPPGMEFTDLIKSSPDSWSEPIAGLTDRIVPPPRSERRAQVYGVAVRKMPPPQIPGMNLPDQVKNGTRIVAYGSSKMIMDQFLAGNNTATLLMFNTIDWLCTGEWMFSIPTRQADETPIVLSLDQQRVIFMITVILIPALLFFGGVSYSVMRRRR
jgi:ABC-type uncharacterized transport system involved in gliding motility auxiliary subunit